MMETAFHFTYEFWRDSRFKTIQFYSIVIKPRHHTETKVKKFLFTEIQFLVVVRVHFKDILDDRLADMIETPSLMHLRLPFFQSTRKNTFTTI
jgi:hypothetical protein